MNRHFIHNILFIVFSLQEDVVPTNKSKMSGPNSRKKRKPVVHSDSDWFVNEEELDFLKKICPISIKGESKAIHTSPMKLYNLKRCYHDSTCPGMKNVHFTARSNCKYDHQPNEMWNL